MNTWKDAQQQTPLAKQNNDILLYTYQMAKIKKKKRQQLIIPNVGRDIEQWENSFTAARNAKWYNHFGRYYDNFLQNQIFLPQYPVFTSLGTYSEQKAYIYTKTYTQIFRAIIHDCQNVEAAKIILQWVSK